MAVDDFLDREVGLAVAATAALLSPQARRVVRQGVVYGLAGALKTGDAVASAARGVGNGVRRAAPGGASSNGEAATTAAPPPARTPRSTRARATPAATPAEADA
jgi:hypothetical protein